MSTLDEYVVSGAHCCEHVLLRCRDNGKQHIRAQYAQQNALLQSPRELRVSKESEGDLESTAAPDS